MAGNINWNQNSIIEKFRQDAYRVYTEQTGIESELFFLAWRAVCMLERQNEENGLFSLRELLPRIHSEYPFFYKYIKDSLSSMLEPCGAVYDLEVMLNRYYAGEQRQDELPFFHLALQCVIDLWEYFVGQERGKTVDKILIETMAMLPASTWTGCMEIAQIGDLSTLLDLKERFEHESQEECIYDKITYVYKWFENTRQELFPNIMKASEKSRRRLKYMRKTLLTMFDILRKWRVNSFIYESMALKNSQDKGLAFLGRGCCDKETFINRTFIQKMIQEYEASERNVADDMEKYMCMRGLWMLANEKAACKSEFQAVLDSMIPREEPVRSYIKTYALPGRRIQRVETE